MKIFTVTSFTFALTFTVIFTGVLIFLTGSPAQAEPRSYPMTCRGGGHLIIENDGNNRVLISFEAAKGAVYNGLKPGQCTWSDRALRKGEPVKICDSDNKRAAGYVGALVQPDKTAIFQVYNDNGTCMRVTRVGP